MPDIHEAELSVDRLEQRWHLIHECQQLFFMVCTLTILLIEITYRVIVYITQILKPPLPVICVLIF